MDVHRIHEVCKCAIAYNTDEILGMMIYFKNVNKGSAIEFLGNRGKFF